MLRRGAIAFGVLAAVATALTGTTDANAVSPPRPGTACQSTLATALAHGARYVGCITDSTVIRSRALAADASPQAAAKCTKGYLTYNRTTACAVATQALTVYDVETGDEVGGMNFTTSERGTDAVKGGRTWKHSISITPSRVWGAAVRESASIQMQCGRAAKSACQVTAHPKTQVLSLGHTSSFPFSLKSPGKNALTHRETPLITLEAPETTPASGELPQLATVRCDSASYLGSTTGGCVNPGSVPVFRMSRTDALVKQAAEHIWSAQRTLKGHPGLQGSGKPLHRTTNAKTIDKNRSRACPSSLHRPAGDSCDEYPFASTKEGGASGVFSRKMINAKQNSRAGNVYLNVNFCKTNRVLDGDAFWVAIS